MVRSGFYGGGVGELRTIVRQNEGEKGLEVTAKSVIESLYPSLYAGGGVKVAEESQHQFGFWEYECEQGFAANSANHRIHLNGLQFRVRHRKGLVVLIGTTISAGTVHLLLLDLDRSGFQFAYARLIKDSNSEHLIADQAGNSAFRNGKVISRMHGNMMDGLPLFNEWRDDGVDAFKLQRRHIVPFTRCAEGLTILLLSDGRLVEPLHERT